MVFLNSGVGIGMYFGENTFFFQRESSVKNLGFGAIFMGILRDYVLSKMTP